MKLRKILAAVAASAVAVSALAVSAFAYNAEVKFEGAAEGGACTSNPINLLSFYTTDELATMDFSKIVKAEMNVQVDSGYCNGFMGSNTYSEDPENAAGAWLATAQIDNTSTDPLVWTLENAGGIDMNSFKVEFWWINPVYGEDPDGEEGPEKAPVEGPGTVTVTNFTFYDADGNVVAPAAADAGADTGADTGADAGDDTAAGDKANSDTGVEGLAVVAGLAIVAAGAVVVAKKRG